MKRLRDAKFLKLRLAMAERGYSQTDLCNAWNATHSNWIYQSNLSRMLCGQTPFKLEMIWFIMKELELPFDEICEYFPEGGGA